VITTNKRYLFKDITNNLKFLYFFSFNRAFATLAVDRAYIRAVESRRHGLYIRVEGDGVQGRVDQVVLQSTGGAHETSKNTTGSGQFTRRGEEDPEEDIGVASG